MDSATLRLLAASRRPDRRAVLRQRWDQLLFLHWRVEAAAVARLLPPGLTVDSFEGETHLGIVGFQMNEVRPVGLPALPWLSYFNELNVRVYVRDAAGEPGVWFLSLDCDRGPAVHLARACFGLPYRHAKMTHRPFGERWTLDCLREGHAHSARYAWKPLTPATPATPGTRLFHLAERYNFFTLQGGRLMRGQVHHAPYALSLAQLTTWSEQPVEWDGFPLAGRPPDHAHCSPGVAVEAFGLVPAHA
jgi:uncharacterized protein YqjF (DUF2071 family)